MTLNIQQDNTYPVREDKNGNIIIVAKSTSYLSHETLIALINKGIIVIDKR